MLKGIRRVGFGGLWRAGEPLRGIERLNGCGGVEGQLRAVESWWLEDCVYRGASSKAIQASTTLIKPPQSSSPLCGDAQYPGHDPEQASTTLHSPSSNVSAAPTALKHPP